MKRMFTLAGALLALAACAETTSGLSQNITMRPLQPGFASWGTSWNTGATLVLVAQLEEVDGKVAVCGAKHQTGNSALLNFELLRKTYFTSNGVNLMSNLNYFAVVKDPDRLDKVQVACKQTDIDWDDKYSDQNWEMDSRQSVFRV